jgi:hypothetical protein
MAETAADIVAAWGFAAYLPRLAAPVRIATYTDAQVFVRRWAIRESDRAEHMGCAMRDFRRELAARGMLSGASS